MLLLLAVSAHAGCPATVTDLGAGIAGVERAFAGLDAAGVASGGARLDLLAACLDAPITPALAVRLHATEGLVAFIAGDADAAAAAFAAARRINRAWTPDPALVPKGHPIRALAVRVDPATLGTERVAPPASGTLDFDGEPGLDRPSGTPTVAQWVVDGTVVSGAYVWPGAPLPPYDVAVGVGSRPSPPPPSVGPWIGVSAAGVVASLTSFYVAGRARTAWEAATTGAEVETHYRENHILVGMGATFGAVALVGGVGAVASVAF